MYDDEPIDYGYDLPDTRHTFIDQHERSIDVVIWRESYAESYRVRFCILCDGDTVLMLPPDTDEHIATQVAHVLFVEDVAATREVNEMLALQAHEMRHGA